MPITQKFYPSFFQAAFQTGFGDGVCSIALFKSGMVPFVKTHTNISDIEDVANKALTASEQNININLNFNIDEEKLYFIIPEVSWGSEVVTEPFNSALIYGNSGDLIIHFDFGEPQAPSSQFTLTSNVSCMPYINLSYSPSCP